MADISKIKTPDGTTYDVKDAIARLKFYALDRSYGWNSIANGTDLNTLTTPGNYRCTNTATAQSLVNSPVQTWFVMRVGYADGSTVKYESQEIIVGNSGVRYYRYNNNGTWQAWQKFDKNTNTTYSAGTGLSLSSTTFNHSNSVTAQTTQAVYPIKIDAQGHISAYGSAVTIPSAVTESTVSGWGFTKNTGTITGIKMNGASKGTSGVVDLGTVLTSHQDISGKVDKINITAQTTQALYPIKINAQGQITAYGSAVTSMTPSSHSHGNITNAGDITATATIASGDRLVINDESASKVTNSSITFGTDTTKFLRNDGTWATAGGGTASTITENTEFNISGTSFYIELVS